MALEFGRPLWAGEQSLTDGPVSAGKQSQAKDKVSPLGALSLLD
jgi:hypothetical protein